MRREDELKNEKSSLRDEGHASDGGGMVGEQCATIGIGIESNRINGADSFLGLLTDYAGIANRSLFDVGLFDLVGERGFVRASRVSAIP
jgi:hypothetical protein